MRWHTKEKRVVLQSKFGVLTHLTVSRASACAFCACIAALLNRLLIGDAGMPNCVVKKLHIFQPHVAVHPGLICSIVAVNLFCSTLGGFLTDMALATIALQRHRSHMRQGSFPCLYAQQNWYWNGHQKNTTLGTAGKAWLIMRTRFLG